MASGMALNHVHQDLLLITSLIISFAFLLFFIQPKTYSCCIWKEDGKEVLGTVPTRWVDIDSEVVYWPKKHARRLCMANSFPGRDWIQYEYVKTKYQSGE